jgi:hypothetical protein
MLISALVGTALTWWWLKGHVTGRNSNVVSSRIPDACV